MVRPYAAEDETQFKKKNQEDIRYSNAISAAYYKK